MNLTTLYVKPIPPTGASRLYSNMYETLFDEPASQGPQRRRGGFQIQKFHAMQMSRLEHLIELITRDPTLKKLYEGSGSTLNTDYKSQAARCYTRSIPEFITIVSKLSNRYLYNEHIQIFKESCAALGLLSMHNWDDLTNGRLSLSNFKDSDTAYTALEKMIWEKCNSISILTAISQRRHASNQLYKDYCRYIDASFEKFNRLVFVRIDLHYKRKDLSNEATAARANTDLARFLNNRRHNELFEGWVGYVAKLEYGVDKGVHWHLMIWFNGNQRYGLRHVNIAKELGEYWVDLTNKEGTYWNCNAEAPHYHAQGRLGVGLIRYNDGDLIHNLKGEVLYYLTKISQLLRPAFGQDFKTIRRGQYPKSSPGQKRGPKRTKFDQHSYCPL